MCRGASTVLIDAIKDEEASASSRTQGRGGIGDAQGNAGARAPSLLRKMVETPGSAVFFARRVSLSGSAAGAKGAGNGVLTHRIH